MTARAADPYLDSGMHGYIRNTAVKEFWRVADWYDDVADLIQDGYMCYAKCRARYVDQLGTLPATNPTDEHRRWMMSLVKTAFWRHIKFTVAGKMQYGHEEPVSQLARDDQTDADPWDKLTPPVDGEAAVLMVLLSLPSELQQLAVLLAGDGAEALGFKRTALARYTTAGGTKRTVSCHRPLRETTNQYYCRLLGIDPAANDVVGKLRAALAR